MQGQSLPMHLPNSQEKGKRKRASLKRIIPWEYQDLSGLSGELTRKAWAWTQIPSVSTSACFSVGSPDSRPHKHEYKYINISLPSTFPGIQPS